MTILFFPMATLTIREESKIEPAPRHVLKIIHSDNARRQSTESLHYQKEKSSETRNCQIRIDYFQIDVRLRYESSCNALLTLPLYRTRETYGTSHWMSCEHVIEHVIESHVHITCSITH
jgi:hypothetical protein